MKGQTLAFFPALVFISVILAVIYLCQQKLLVESFKERIATQQAIVQGAVKVQAKLSEQTKKNKEQLESVKEYQEYQSKWSSKIATYKVISDVLNRVRKSAVDDNQLVLSGKLSPVDIKWEKDDIVQINVEVSGNISQVISWIDAIEYEIDYLRHQTINMSVQNNGKFYVQASFLMNFKVLEQ